MAEAAATGFPRLLMVLPLPEDGGAEQAVRKRRFLRAGLLAALRASRFQVEQLPPFGESSKLKGKEVFALGLGWQDICRAAEAEAIPKQIVLDAGQQDGREKATRWRPFDRSRTSHLRPFSPEEPSPDFFDAAEVLMLLRSEAYGALLPHGHESSDFPALAKIGRTVSVLALAEHAGVVESVTALHDDDEALLVLEGGLQVDDMVRYFGVHVTQYFQFLNEYIVWLVCPAGAGVVCWLWHRLLGQGEFSHSALALPFAIGSSIWSTCFLESVKRKYSELKHRFGYRHRVNRGFDMSAPADFQVPIAQLGRAMAGEAEPEPEDRPDSNDISKELSAIIEWGTGKHNDRVLILRILFLLPVIGGLMASSGAVILFLLWVSDYLGKNYEHLLVKNAGTPLMLGVTVLLEGFYSWAANMLTRGEAMNSYPEFVRSLTAKNGAFQLVNSTGFFMFLAFWLQDIKYLDDQIFIFLTVKQGIALSKETLLPIVLHRGRGVWATREKLRQRLKEHGVVDTARSVQDLANQAGEEALEGLRKRAAAAPAVIAGSSMRGSTDTMAKGKKLDLVKEAEDQLDYAPVDLSGEYIHLAVLFLVTSSFAVACPLGPALALAVACTCRWTDGYKVLQVSRRFVPRTVDVAVSDTWIEIFESISLFACASNIIIFGIVNKDWPPLTLAAIEHLVLALKMYLAWSIPDQPAWVTQSEVAFDAVEHRRHHGD